MQVGSPLEVKRGYVFDDTRFYQQGREVNRADVKEKLKQNRAAADNMSRGSSFETASVLTRMPGFILVSLGISSMAGAFETSSGAKVGLIAGGAGLLCLSGTFAGVAEANYVTAVGQYNRSPSTDTLSP